VFTSYDRGELLGHGFDPATPRTQLDAHGVDRLLHVASSAMEAAIAGGRDCDYYDAADSWELVTRLTRGADDDVPAAIQHVLRLEALPSIGRMILDGAIPVEKLAEIRRRDETVAFRKWLWSQPDPRDAKAVTDAYLGALTGAPAKTRRRWKTAARIVAVSTAGSGAGAIVGGSLGGIAGAVLGGVASAAISLVDGFVLDPVGGTPNPRRFATDVLQPLVLQHRTKR
jgi:hypothetical protein